MQLVCMNAFLVAFYYTNINFFIPKLLTQKKWVWYILVVAVCLYIYVLLPLLFEDAIREELLEKFPQVRGERPQFPQARGGRPMFPQGRGGRPGGRSSWIPYPFTGATAVFFLVFTVSTCIRVIQQWLNTEKRNEEVEKEKLVTELSFLKSQINPHFLFNTLNNIYSLALVKSDATAGAVLKLSAIMRYVLNETKHNWVPLEKEIEFINHFIDLQKVRLTDKMSIRFHVSGNVEGQQIAPLILIPFIENAFKYGVSTKEPSEITLELRAENNTISFFIKNKILKAENNPHDNTAIGLKNTRRRLELLYPDKHTLTVSEENNQFIVNLILSR